MGDEGVESLLSSISHDDLLDGYEASEHGSIIVALDDVVYASNVDGHRRSDDLEEAVGPEVVEAIDVSIEGQKTIRLVYGTSPQTSGATVDGGRKAGSSPYIAYLYAESVTVPVEGGDDYQYRVVAMHPSSKVFEKRPSIMAWMTLSSFVLLLAVFAIVFQLVNRVVIRRIDEENDALSHITEGNLDVRAGAGGTREFESLSEGINVTVGALKGLIAEAETRMDAELNTARAIQESALPRTFPPYPDIPRFDIYASMNAAKQVGGDFYDLFLVGDDCGPDSGKLAFVVADVSGKGVPAALFMMEAKTQIRSYVSSGMELGEAIENANRQLCDGNDAGMFVTAWVGVLDYATGHVDYVNAGHNPPLLWAFGGDDQSAGWRWLTERSGLPLGLFDGLPYTAHSVDCLPGDQFLLYSDGVTEAMSTGEELYGEARLEELANGRVGEHPRQLVEAEIGRAHV